MATKNNTSSVIAPEATTPAPKAGGDDFLKSLQDTLMSQAGMVSSDGSLITNKIREAIGSTKQAADATAQGINSAFDRSRGYLVQEGEQNIQKNLEARQGFGTVTAVIKNSAELSQRALNDLDSRRQEALLNNDAATAKIISDLQIKELESQQEQRKTAFNMILQTSNFALSARSEQRQERAQSFQERSAIASLASEYGVPVSENDTIDTITAKIAPLASEEQKLRIAGMRADIRRSEAETAAAVKRAAEDEALSPDDIELLSQAALINGSILANISDPNVASKVTLRAEEIRIEREEAKTAEDKRILEERKKNAKTIGKGIEQMRQSRDQVRQGVFGQFGF